MASPPKISPTIRPSLKASSPICRTLPTAPTPRRPPRKRRSLPTSISVSRRSSPSGVTSFRKTSSRSTTPCAKTTSRSSRPLPYQQNSAVTLGNLNNFRQNSANQIPFVSGQNDDGKLAVLETLLIREICVGSKKQFKTRFFGGAQQVSIR